MPKKTLTAAIKFVTQRNGEQVSVSQGQTFDFTKDELADLDRMGKSLGVEQMYRNPKNEEAEEVTAAPATKAPAEAGKKGAEGDKGL